MVYNLWETQHILSFIKRQLCSQNKLPFTYMLYADDATMTPFAIVNKPFPHQVP